MSNAHLCFLPSNSGIIRFSVFFSVDLTYPYLNFRVGVGQRGFRIRGVKCIGRNPLLAVLCRIAAIPVNRSWTSPGMLVGMTV